MPASMGETEPRWVTEGQSHMPVASSGCCRAWCEARTGGGHAVEVGVAGIVLATGVLHSGAGHLLHHAVPHTLQRAQQPAIRIFQVRMCLWLICLKPTQRAAASNECSNARAAAYLVPPHEAVCAHAQESVPVIQLRTCVVSKTSILLHEPCHTVCTPSAAVLLTPVSSLGAPLVSLMRSFMATSVPSFWKPHSATVLPVSMSICINRKHL